MANPVDLSTRDEDRLPWLETVEAEYDRGPSLQRILLLLALGVAIIAAAVFVYLRYDQTREIDGNGDLIAAQEGDYKVKPDDPGGLKVQGEGDTAIATSDGTAGGNAVIDVNAAPEAPVTGTRTKPNVTGAGGSKAVVAVPASGGRLTAAPAGPGRLPAAGAASSGGALVQLGSFASEGEANAVWAKSAKRFTYLEPLGKSVQQAEVNGRTVYRLRVNAGSAGQASALCGKLKVAGEACFVASN